MAQREQVLGGGAGALLVVDHDRVAGDVGEAPVDLDHGDAVANEQLGRLAAHRGHDHAGRTHREERAGAGQLLQRVPRCRR